MYKYLLVTVTTLSLTINAAQAIHSHTVRADLSDRVANDMAEWASRTVWLYQDKHPELEGNKLGSYDFCVDLADSDEEESALGLDWDKYPKGLVNACAIVIHGTEF